MAHFLKFSVFKSVCFARAGRLISSSSAFMAQPSTATGEAAVEVRTESVEQPAPFKLESFFRTQTSCGNKLANDDGKLHKYLRRNVLRSFQEEVARRMEQIREYDELQESVKKLETGVEDIVDFASRHSSMSEFAAREFSNSIARCYLGLLMLERASVQDANQDDVHAAQSWCLQDLVPVLEAEKIEKLSDLIPKRDDYTQHVTIGGPRTRFDHPEWVQFPDPAVLQPFSLTYAYKGCEDHSVNRTGSFHTVFKTRSSEPHQDWNIL